MLTFEKILSDEQIKNTALLADQIWHQHFIGIIPEGQIDYMIEKFQSYRAIKAQLSDGYEIRRCAVENNVTMFTSLDTVRVLLDVLEEITITVSTIDKA